MTRTGDYAHSARCAQQQAPTRQRVDVVQGRLILLPRSRLGARVLERRVLADVVRPRGAGGCDAGVEKGFGRVGEAIARPRSRHGGGAAGSMDECVTGRAVLLLLADGVVQWIGHHSGYVAGWKFVW